MKPRRHPGSLGFTLLDLIAVLFVGTMLVYALLPKLVGGGPTKGSMCNLNLQNMGAGFHAWAGDHGDRFPQQVSTNQGGTLEIKDGEQLVRSFRALSNHYLGTPRLLICPSDRQHRPAPAFDAQLTRRNFSYFLNLDATVQNTNGLLLGESHLQTRETATNGVLYLPPGAKFQWTKQRHQTTGRVLWADGSVSEHSGAPPENFWQRVSLPARLAMPD